MRTRHAKKIRAGLLAGPRAGREPLMLCAEHPGCDEMLIDFVTLRHNLTEYERSFTGPGCIAERARYRKSPRFDHR
jgi:hypothetical protein